MLLLDVFQQLWGMDAISGAPCCCHSAASYQMIADRGDVEPRLPLLVIIRLAAAACGLQCAACTSVRPIFSIWRIWAALKEQGNTRFLEGNACFFVGTHCRVFACACMVHGAADPCLPSPVTAPPSSFRFWLVLFALPLFVRCASCTL